ncbi:MAG: tRNA (adenosine(37)-N6)-threonylcarbamoyltransferase complex transferase subunit TsaD [Candidatus Obscuribacterales bacterium]|jgi:N6-L-threonylcarbamoyladenine synthase|nr:tRNA (adenosine(37)-N6)-threonylcarbamoyltransferase complex transferase subunit TsaD [Candidatus Obscuribacterales bacterium]
MTIYLGIETSCDETAAAVVADGRKVLSNCLFSQVDIHKKFGGVVPEVAARQHLESVNNIIDEAMQNAGLGYGDLDGIAYTAGPGLIGTLITGMLAAKALSWSYNLPLLAVDHLLAHVCANYLQSDLEPPFLALLVSGGHTQIVHFTSYTEASIIGRTLDDAAGEAYDKVARLLGLGYPGGAIIDRLAQKGNAQAFKFPEGVVAGYDFSFSGLKTAVLRTVEKLAPPLPVEDLAASFQDAVCRVLVRKTLKAQSELGAPRIVLAGGVAANKTLRDSLVAQSPVPVYFPDRSFCTDNAAMVAGAAYFVGKKVSLAAGVYPRQLVK